MSNIITVTLFPVYKLIMHDFNCCLLSRRNHTKTVLVWKPEEGKLLFYFYLWLHVSVIVFSFFFLTIVEESIEQGFVNYILLYLFFYYWSCCKYHYDSNRENKHKEGQTIKISLWPTPKHVVDYPEMQVIIKKISIFTYVLQCLS